MNVKKMTIYAKNLNQSGSRFFKKYFLFFFYLHVTINLFLLFGKLGLFMFLEWSIIVEVKDFIFYFCHCKI